MQIDTTGLSEADIATMRNARVVDMRTINGRPLTEDEARQLTARMQQNNMPVVASNQRPLYLPPAEYFTQVGDASLVCRAASGELVSLRDDRCPADVRRAIERKLVVGPTVVTHTRNDRIVGIAYEDPDTPVDQHRRPVRHRQATRISCLYRALPRKS